MYSCLYIKYIVTIFDSFSTLTPYSHKSAERPSSQDTRDKTPSEKSALACVHKY